jgi:TonB-linked SusC/RagA family outer membrane protein
MKQKKQFLFRNLISILLALFWLLSSAKLYAEIPTGFPQTKLAAQRQITGKVTDRNGEALPGVNIVEKGTTNGANTNVNGAFSIAVSSADATLVISFIGYTSQEVKPGAKTELSIVLLEDVVNLEDVVVVGYGTQVKKNITGSVSTIQGADVSKRSVTNLSTALQGAVAGVTSTRNSSVPGAESSLRIRGITTLAGSSDPLILVDDIPYASINDINPADVETITFLKDAAASAIYGSRAAAGVIIVTTKRAKEGNFSAQYNLEYVVNTPTRVPSNVGGIRHMEMSNEQAYNDGASSKFSLYSEDYIKNYLSNNALDPDQYPNVDWAALIVKDYSQTKRHTLNFTGGSKNVKTVATFGYETSDALYDNYEYNRYTGRINNDLKITEKFGVLLDASLNVTKTEAPIVNPTFEAIQMPAIYAPMYQRGEVAPGKTGDNVYGYYQFGGFRNSGNNKFFSKIGVYYLPVKGMKVSFNMAPTYNFNHAKSFSTKVPYWGLKDPDHLQPPLYLAGHLTNDLWESRGEGFSLTTNALVNYGISKNGHTLDAVIGYEEFYSKNESLSLKALKFESADYPYMSQAPVGSIYDDGTSVAESAYRSFFGRLAYNYNDKYFIQANARADGSSKFHQDYRWGVFPSVSLGWVLTKEKFMESLNSPLSFLKLRSSYGSLGNDRLGNYLYVANLGFTNVLISQGASSQSVKAAALQKLAIQDITWETTTTLNFGIDVNLFKNKLSLNADYFIKKTTDMLLDLNVPDLIGYEDPRYNVGSMDTKGWEVQAGWRDHINELNYSVSLNVYDAKSVIGDINGKELFDGNTISREGAEYRTWYGYQSDGLFQTQAEVDASPKTSAAVKPGDMKYKDLGGPAGIPDNIINSYDRVELGGSLPRYQYGGNINLDYKGVDLGITFQGIGKQTSQLNGGAWQPFPRTWMATPAIYDGNYWSKDNTAEQNLIVKYPRLSLTTAGNNNAFSDFNLISGAYFRVKNLSLGYTIPKNIVQKVKLSNVRFYVTANDLISFDQYPDGWDPEYGGGYLITKSLIFGLQLKF